MRGNWLILKGDFKFPRRLRLTSQSQFRSVFKNACRKAVCRDFLILANENALDVARIGLAISKKHVKKAVDRNKVKRVVRESFRKNAKVLGGLDLVLVSRESLKHLTSLELKKILESKWLSL